MQSLAWPEFWSEFCLEHGLSKTSREVRNTGVGVDPWALKQFRQAWVLCFGLRFRGPGRRSLGAKSQKVSKKSRKSLEKAGVPEVREKSLEKGPKSLQKPIFRLFFDFPDLFRDFFQTFATPARETFLRLFGFWPRDSFSQVHGTSSFGHF